MFYVIDASPNLDVGFVHMCFNVRTEYMFGFNLTFYGFASQVKHNEAGRSKGIVSTGSTLYAVVPIFFSIFVSVTFTEHDVMVVHNMMVVCLLLMFVTVCLPVPPCKLDSCVCGWKSRLIQ